MRDDTKNGCVADYSPVGSVVFALQHFVTPITNLISCDHSYTQKFSIPHNIRILYGNTDKDHYILIVIIVISNRSWRCS